MLGEGGGREAQGWCFDGRSVSRCVISCMLSKAEAEAEARVEAAAVAVELCCLLGRWGRRLAVCLAR